MSAGDGVNISKNAGEGSFEIFKSFANTTSEQSKIPTVVTLAFTTITKRKNVDDNSDTPQACRRRPNEQFEDYLDSQRLLCLL